MENLKYKKLTSSINLALNWLTKSGIQNNNKNLNEFGAYYAWYSVKEKKYSYMYSEISGYLITSLVYHYKISKKIFF